MRLAKICDEVLARWRKKQKSTTNSRPEIIVDLNEAIGLPNLESGRLWLLIHELWDEVHMGVTSTSILMRYDEVETLSFGRNALSYSKNRKQFQSTMQRLRVSSIYNCGSWQSFARQA